MPICVACQIDHPRESFSKAQLRKPQDNKRCQNCIEFHNTILQVSAASISKTTTAVAAARNSVNNRIRPNFHKDPASMEQATAAAYFAVANESALIAAREDMNDDNHQQHFSSTFQPTSPTSPFENRFNNVNQSNKNPKWGWPSSAKKQENDENNGDDDDDNNFVEIICDDDDDKDDDATDKKQNAAHVNNSSFPNEDLHHLDKECSVCMEEFHWDFPSLQQNSNKNEKGFQKEQHQHPHTPKILPCSHICCLTCVSRIIGAVRKINNERRISENNDRVASLRNSGMMIMRRSQMEFSAVNDGNNQNGSFLIMDEKDKKPACPICRREFFVAADVPRGVREKMKTIIVAGNNNNGSVNDDNDDDMNDKNLKNKNTNSDDTAMTFNNLRETLHVASIGNDVPGIIINLNSDRQCGSIALCETGKCVLFFAPKESSSSSSSDFSLLQLGMRIVCNVSELQGNGNNTNNTANLNKNNQKSKNMKVLLRGELVATSVRTLQHYASQLFEEAEKEKRRQRVSRNGAGANDDDDEITDGEDNVGERRMERESTREVSMFDIDSGDGAEETNLHGNNHSNNRMNDYYYDRSGRRVYGHDDDAFEEEEEDDVYDDGNDDYQDYLDSLEEQHDTRYAGF